MAFVHGKNSVFKLDNSSGSITDISAYLDSVDGLPGDVETADTTTFGASAKTSIPGLKSAVKIGLSGKHDTTVDAIIGAHVNAGGSAISGTASVSFEWHPQGTAATTPKYTGECWVTSYSVDSKPDGVVTWKASLEVTGGVTRGTN